MVELFHDFLYGMELLDEYGDLDNEALDSICDAMTKRYNEQEEEE